MLSKWFNGLFTNASPQRREAKFRVETDNDGNPVLKPTEVVAHQDSEDGSLDTITLDIDSFYHCGCNAKTQPLGGKCGEPGCANTSCARCFENSRCLVCRRPLCLECAFFEETDDGETLCFCKTHRDEHGRGRLLRRTTRAFLKPFVEFNDENESTK